MTQRDEGRACQLSARDITRSREVVDSCWSMTFLTWAAAASPARWASSRYTTAFIFSPSCPCICFKMPTSDSKRLPKPYGRDSFTRMKLEWNNSILEMLILTFRLSPTKQWKYAHYKWNSSFTTLGECSFHWEELINAFLPQIIPTNQNAT